MPNKRSSLLVGVCSVLAYVLGRNRRKSSDHGLAGHLARQIEWSTQTFGPGLRTLGVTRHIEKEIAEIRRDPTDRIEWVDVIQLGLDGYWRAGGTPRTIMPDLIAKLNKNMARQWPPIAPEDEPMEHIR